MSAIDNAFIRAYTLDATALSASAKSDDDQSTFASPVAVVPKSQGGVAQASPSPASSSRRAIATPPSAKGAAIARRTSLSAAPKTPASMRAAALSPVVPVPHIRLAAFIHTTTTLEPSSTNQTPTNQTSAILESATLDLPTVASELPEAESLAEEGPVVAASETLGIVPEMTLPESQQTPPTLAPSIAPPNAAASLPPSLPATMPVTADVAATLDLEAEGPRAAFEVDQFAWPDLCNTLLEQRAAEFDQLVGQLVTESALGRKVVAITGSRRGEGRTTLALLLARRLAATAVKVVVVDADFEAPQLAARLGMTVQSGWQNVLTDGLPVWDGLVESLTDHVALLPLAPRPSSSAGQPSAVEFVAQHTDAIRQHLDTLRKHFDVVLVDAGAVKAARPDAKPRGPLALADSLDAAIMVSDARTAAPGRIADLQRRLHEARIVPLGIAENFCPSKPE